MNKIESELVQSLSDIRKWVKDAKRFTMDHAPDVAKQLVAKELNYLVFHLFAKELPLAIFGFYMSFLTCMVWVIARKHGYDGGGLDDLSAAGVSISRLLSIGFTIYWIDEAWGSIAGIISIKTAPKVFIIEWMRDQINPE